MSEPAHTVRPPQQRRSRQSYERVLEAGTALLAENGAEGFTIQDVAERSGVSVGAIYERFGNKVTLLHAIHDEVMGALADARARRGVPDLSGVTATEAIVAAVERLGRHFQANRAVLSAFMHLGAVDEVIATRGSRGSIELGDEFKASLRPHLGEFPHPDRAIALDVAYRMAYCTFARQVMYGPTFESSRRIGWARLVAEVTAACVAYLLHPPYRSPQ